MRILSWLVGLAFLILLGLAAWTYGPGLLQQRDDDEIWVAQPSAPPPEPEPAAPQVAVVAPPPPPKVQPVEIPVDSQIEEDAAAVGMTTLEPEGEADTPAT